MDTATLSKDYSEKKFSVLIADDNPNNLKVLSAMLEKLGYRIRVATSGDMTLQSVKLIKPDLILLDIHMPGMDGYEVCRILKLSDEFKDIPVIFLSALSEVFNKIQAFNAGGVDYITKPFELEEVQIRIENHLKLKEKTLMLQNALTELQNKEEMLIRSEKMAALGVLTAGIAHEINNPVNFIANSISALEERIRSIVPGNRLPDEQMIEDFENIFSHINIGIEQITKTIHSLRLYSGTDNCTMVDTDLKELINSALVIMNHRLANGIAVQQYVPPVSFKCQPGKLSQVLINIISNSIDAVEEAVKSGIINDGHGEISISAENSEDRITIKITDNGNGIDSSIIKKAFDPFFTTKAVGRGVGLGLSICQGIIKDHNGNIDVESHDKKGTSVTISLPLQGDNIG